MRKKRTVRTVSGRSRGATTLYSHERAVCTAAFVVFMFAFSTYMYFLCASVVNVVMRQEADTEITAISHRINSLEARYIDAESRVTKAAALERGFITPDDKVYLTKKPENLVLRTNDES